jgi:hypothetical protein
MNITADILAGFYCTEHHHRHLFGMLYTDGIHYLAENGAGWLVDAIASYQGSKELQTESFKYFQFWNLKVTGKTAVLTCVEDSGMTPVITQEIELTDFPFDIDIWVENGVMILPSEH